MKREPKVSVVIPTYNSVKYVTEAIDSVLAQTYENIEIFVIDDGSTDNTKEVLQKYGDAINYLYKENGGVSSARNYGIENATGKYIAFLDADDAWLSDKLEKQVHALEKNKYSACYTAFTIGGKDLNPLEVNQNKHFGTTLENLLLHGGNNVGTPSTVVVEKKLFREVGGFDSELSYSADWEMWIRLSAQTEFLYIEKPLIIYRTHDSNLSNNLTLQEKDCIAVMEKAFAMDNLPSTIMKKRNIAFASTYMVLAGNYFQAKMYRDFLRCAIKSISMDYKKISYLLSYPIRWTHRQLSR